MSAEVHASHSSVDRKNPFSAQLVARKRLTKENFVKETVHLTLDISGSGISYECGDALGVYPENAPARVDSLLKSAGFSGSESVALAADTPAKTETISLRDALTSRLSLRHISKPLLQLACNHAADAAEKQALADVFALEDAVAQKAWFEAREVSDLFEDFPSVRISAQEFAANLRKLTPRLYSISSSPRKDPTKIELSLAVVAYESNDRKREGICSNYLAHHAPLGVRSIRVFPVHSHFKPPVSPKTPIIMVGPGVGIAPFRSFLQDRECRRNAGEEVGPAWLFFGDWHKASDFLYEDEIAAWNAAKILENVSLAWSRDNQKPGQAKVYVQHQMRNEGATIWEWLDQRNASFYVCGDAKYMAKDVDAALVEIVEKHGGKSSVDALDYVKALRQSQNEAPARYQRDVY